MSCAYHRNNTATQDADLLFARCKAEGECTVRWARQALHATQEDVLRIILEDERLDVLVPSHARRRDDEWVIYMLEKEEIL